MAHRKSYMNIGPNVVGGVTVQPPPSGQPLSGELIVSTDPNDAQWGTNVGLGVYTSAGDLSGSSTYQIVVGLMNNPLPSLSDGYLNWDGHQWLYSTIILPTELPPIGTAGGDLQGQYPNPTLIDFGALGTFGGDGYTTLQISTDGYGRVSSVTPIPIVYPPPITSLPVGGELTGTTDNAGLVPVGTAGTYGDGYNYTVITTDGYGRVSSVSTEPLPTEFTVGGDISGTTADAVVAAIQTNPVASHAPTAGQVLIQNSTATGSMWSGLTGDVQLSAITPGQATVIGLDDFPLNIPALGAAEDGYVLTYVNADGYLEMMPPTGGGGGGGFTAGGDLSGSSTSQTVVGIQGYSVPVPQSGWHDSNNQYLTWVPQRNTPPPWFPGGPGLPIGSWSLVDVPQPPIVLNGSLQQGLNSTVEISYSSGMINSSHAIYMFPLFINTCYDYPTHPSQVNVLLDTADIVANTTFGYAAQIRVTINDPNGQASTVPIVITTNTPTVQSNYGSTTTISGNSSYTINSNYGSVTFDLVSGFPPGDIYGPNYNQYFCWNWIINSHS